MSFPRMLDAARRRNKSLLCVGLDPLPERLPRGLGDDLPSAVVAFNRAIIEATADLVCAYKPNLAFYEALGPRGWWALAETIRAAPRDLAVIADAKRGDIGSSAERYASAIFDELGCAACTVSPYMGADSIEPFTRAGRFAFVLCHTSNPGATEYQELSVTFEGHPMPLYQVVALQVARWERAPHCGLVAGATFPEAMTCIRSVAPEMTLLIPGLGTQGGDARATLQAAHAEQTRLLVNVSREIIYAPADSGGFAVGVRRAAEQWRAMLNASVEADAAVGESADADR